MNRLLLVAGCMCLSISTAFAQSPLPGRGAGFGGHPVMMGVTSPAFDDGGILPDRFSGKANAPGKPAGSPALAWTGAPTGTQSFTLIMHDLDVVMGKTTNDNLHWLMFDIPANVTSLPEGVPNTPTLANGAVQLKNRVGIGYDGPGAPAGIYHHYVIEVYALDAKLALGPDASRDDVWKAMDGHVLDKGTLVARFHR